MGQELAPFPGEQAGGTQVGNNRGWFFLSLLDA